MTTKNNKLEQEVREQIRKINEKLNKDLQKKPEWDLDRVEKKKVGRPKKSE